jgi:hypothetical protein
VRHDLLVVLLFGISRRPLKYIFHKIRLSERRGMVK